MTRYFGILLPIVLLVVQVASTVEASQADRRTEFVERAVARLKHEGVPPDKIQDIQVAYSEWRESGYSEELWAVVSDAVAAGAFRRNVSSQVTVTTIPEDGALVRYQLVGERRRGAEPRTMGASETTKDLTIGDYHIWSEREGQPTTSPDDWYEIISQNELIKLAEEY